MPRKGLLELAQDPQITSTDIKSDVHTPGEGIGCLEAPRGVLIHHYVADKNGITTDVNLVVGTTNNNAPYQPLRKEGCQGADKELAGIPWYPE